MRDRERYVDGTALLVKSVERPSLTEDYEKQKMKRRASVEKGSRERETAIYENAYVLHCAPPRHRLQLTRKERGK